MIFEKNKRLNTLLLAIILVILFFLPIFFDHAYLKHIMIMVFIYAIAAQAWNILGGYTGQISLGNAMFFGVGAYTSSVLLVNFNVNPWIGLVIGGFMSILLGLFVGFPVFRLRSHYFVIATLAAGEIIYTIFLNWDYVNGATGIELPLLQDSLKNMTFLYNKNGFYYISLIILIAFIYLVFRLAHSKLGYYFRTIKEEEEAAKSIGINTRTYKLVAISFTAFFTAIAGTIYAQYLLYIDPAMLFPTNLSIKFVLVAALGGSGTILGPIIGAFILIPVTELTRVFFGGAGQGIDLLIYGVLIVIVALFRPDGLITFFKK